MNRTVCVAPMYLAIALVLTLSAAADAKMLRWAGLRRDPRRRTIQEALLAHNAQTNQIPLHRQVIPRASAPT